MPRSLHVIRFFVISLGLHVVFFAALYFFEGPVGGAPKETTPVRIVNLPPQVAKRLPLIQKPIPIPKRSLTRLENDAASVIKAKSPQVSIPASTENGRPDGTGKGHIDTVRKDTGTAEKGKSPLPFLSQADVDELARKGFPEWKIKDEPLTEETMGFKYYGYTKWALQKANKNLTYPELAAVSGLQGDVFVNLDILRDGSVGSIDVVKSSGYKILDDAVVGALRGSAPYQPLPEDWHTDHYTIPIIGTFRLYYRELR
jgi:protein TonB